MNIEYLNDVIPPLSEKINDISIDSTVPEDEIGEKGNPTFMFQGFEIDVDTARVVGLLLVIWIFIWRITGVYTSLRHDLLFTFIFISFTIYLLTALVTSGHYSGSITYELNILLSVEQMLIIVFGTVVLFTLFSSKLSVHESCAPVIKRINLAMLVLLCTANLWVSIYNSPRAFRTIRKMKQGIYNIVMIMFMVCLMIILRGNQCEFSI